MNAKELHPGIIIASIVVVLGILGYFGWRAMAPPSASYHGGPINMGKVMHGGGGGGSGGPASTGAPPVRHGPPTGIPGHPAEPAQPPR